MEPSGTPPHGAEAGTPPGSPPRSPPRGHPLPGSPRGPERGRKRPPGGHREPPPGGKRHKTGEPGAAPPAPSDGDRLFAQKCRELRGFIRPLTELLNGLKMGRYDKGLSSFQQSVAMDRIQRIIGVLQKPEMGARYLGTLLQVEVMLRGWFPHVAPKPGSPPGAQDPPPKNPDPPQEGGAWGTSPSPVGVLLLLHDRLRARRAPPGGATTDTSGTPPRHGGGQHPKRPPPTRTGPPHPTAPDA